MAFASIHIPDFLIQAVVRAEPGLRHCAVALVHGASPIWNVVAANEAALRAGIHLGMAKSQAAQFRSIEIRLRSQAQEKASHAALMDLGWSISPRVEDTAPDTIVLDIAGLHSLFDSVENIANQLTERASNLGLIANVAVACNIEVAVFAARGFPGITLILPGEESKRLGCLPIRVLPASAEVLETLERWGIRTCEAFAALPALELSERLGQEGVHLHELARGVSLRSLVLAEPALFFEEEMALEDAVAELEPLAFILGRLLDQLCARLDARSLAANSIRLRFDLDPSSENDFQPLDGDSRRRRGGSRKSTPNLKPQPKTYEKVLTLPVPIRDSKMLLKLLRLQLQSDPPTAPILKISLAADPARPRTAQGGLFLPSSPDPEKLELTLARLANVVGNSNIGSPELIDTHRPGEFRPALPAKVDLRDACPIRIFFQGIRGDVVVASGPWRTSGDWWRADGWHHDEWDLEIHIDSSVRHEQAANPHSPKYPQHAVYRVYYDSIRQSWFVRGIYD